LGTPFNDVHGDIFICLEVCHLGSFIIVQDPDLPVEDEYKNLIWIINNLIFINAVNLHYKILY